MYNYDFSTEYDDGLEIIIEIGIEMYKQMNHIHQHAW